MQNEREGTPNTYRRSLRFDLRSSDQLFMLRIPQTGAEYLYHMLSVNFPPEVVWPIDGDDTSTVIEHKGVGRLSDYRLLWTEHDYSIYRPFPRKPVFFTVIREPIERVVAVYRRVLEDTNHALHDEVRARNLSLKDFVRYPPAQNLVTNRQIRQLAGAVQGDWRELSHEAMFDLARLRLEEIAYFALSEKLERSWELLSHTFKFAGAAALDNQTIRRFTVSPDGFDSETRRAIREVNRLDLRLYAHASRVFEKRMEQMQHEVFLPPERLYRTDLQLKTYRAILALGDFLRRSRAALLLGWFRRLVIPEGSNLERRYLQWRKRNLGW
jgi:hypothetical protein